MQIKSDTSHSTAPNLEGIANTFRLTGWISFWLQLALIVVAGLTLLFAISGRNVSEVTYQGLGIGIFWAVCAVLALCFGAYLAFRYTRIGKRLTNPNSVVRPSKSDTIQLVRLGIMVGFVGMLLSILGAGATVGVLVAKAISQPPGVAITDPYKIIRALDVFVMVANLNGMTAHFVGAATSLWLLERAHRQ